MSFASKHELITSELGETAGADGNKHQRDTNRLPFPYEINKIDPETNSQLLKYFTGERTGFIQVGPKKWFFPSGYAQEAENYYNFELRSEDVFVITFPRSGTTWIQEMVWLLCNNLDYKRAADIPLTERFPFLEYSCVIHKDTKAKFLEENMSDPTKYEIVQNINYPVWKSLAASKDRRFIKTHLPFSLLPPNLTRAGCKVIYIARNPKDVAVSYYHLNRMMRTRGYVGDFPKFWQYFQQNLQTWAPYWEHVKEGWKMRHEKNVLFVFYENMNKNLRNHIEKVAAFLGVNYTSDQLDDLENHLKFENFRNNKSVNFDQMEQTGIALKDEQSFVRKGKTGDSKEYFNQELEENANQWIEENLRETDLRFPV